MARVAGDAIKLDQRQFDFLMGIIAAQLARFGAEGVDDMVDRPDHHIEEFALAAGEEIGDRALQQMTHGIHFMKVSQVGPALLRLTTDEPGIEIAVRHLALCQAIDDVIDLGFEFGIGMGLERIAGRLDPLAEIAVEEMLHR